MLTTLSKQAAEALDTLHMESPTKKLNYGQTNKENEPIDESALAALADEMDKHEVPVEAPKTELVKKEVAAPVAAPTTKPQEVDEPLLQENPQRFVLFPIKYHEVRDAS